jgi:hypothetical protein
MTSQSDVYVDLENHTANNSSHSEQDTCYKACKSECYKGIVDLANLLIPICLVFGCISLIIFLVSKFSP